MVQHCRSIKRCYQPLLLSRALKTLSAGIACRFGGHRPDWGCVREHGVVQKIVSPVRVLSIALICIGTIGLQASSM